MLITVSLPKIKILQRFDLCARDCDFLPLRLNLPAQRRDVSIPRDGLPLLAAGAMEQTRLLVNDPGTVAVAGNDPCGPVRRDRGDFAPTSPHTSPRSSHRHLRLSAASVVGCPMKSSLVEVRQRGEPNLGGLSDPAFTRSRFGISITRFCVRTLASSCEILSGWSFPPSVLFACREYRLTVAASPSFP
jgi:hypothetical protein